MFNDFVLDKKYLETVKGMTLFYPCCGNDCANAIELFSPYMSEYWLVDLGFMPNFRIPANSGYIFKQEARVRPDTAFISQKDRENGKSYDRLRPFVITDTYTHEPDGRTVKIHRCKDYGFTAFEREITSLGVFYYRGDSQGEGGSGDVWLNAEMWDKICGKLVPGGLIVTDGSWEGGPWRDNVAYCELNKNWFKEEKDLPGDIGELIRSYKPFTDDKGRKFTCVGFAGYRYGPTMIWKVDKSQGISALPSRYC